MAAPVKTSCIDLPPSISALRLRLKNPKRNPRRLRCGRSIHDVLTVPDLRPTPSNVCKWPTAAARAIRTGGRCGAQRPSSREGPRYAVEPPAGASVRMGVNDPTRTVESLRSSRSAACTLGRCDAARRSITTALAMAATLPIGYHGRRRLISVETSSGPAIHAIYGCRSQLA